MKTFKISVLFLVLTLCLGITSCGSDDNNSDVPEKGYVELQPDNVKLTIGKKQEITPVFSNETVGNQKFKWSIDDTDIASFEFGDGRQVIVTALKEGSTFLKIESKDLSISAICKITVVKEDVGNNDPIRLLAIGNSFTDNAVNDHIYKLAEADNRTVVIARMTIGGATIEEHLENAKTNSPYSYAKTGSDGRLSGMGAKSIADVVSSEDWDYISFQQQSWLAGQFDSYEPYMQELVEYVKSKSKNPNTIYAMLQTWAFAYDYGYDDYDYYDNNQLTMHAALVDAVERTSNLVSPKMLVIPAGTAIQNGRTSALGDRFCQDGYHLNGTGCFVAACTYYEIITSQNVTINEYVPQGISDRDIKIAKNAAHYAALKPKQVTEMTDFQ